MNMYDLLDQHDKICKLLDRSISVTANLTIINQRLDDIEGGINDEAKKTIADAISAMSKITDMCVEKKFDVVEQIKQRSL